MEQLLSIFVVATVGVLAGKAVDKGIDKVVHEVQQRRYYKAKDAEWSTKHRARRAFACNKR